LGQTPPQEDAAPIAHAKKDGSLQFAEGKSKKKELNAIFQKIFIFFERKRLYLEE
jgi:hypothetical protein